MINKFRRVLFSFVALFSLLLNILMPLAMPYSVLAQEATPSSEATVSPAPSEEAQPETATSEEAVLESTPAPDQISPTEAPVEEPVVEAPTPEPSSEPTPIASPPALDLTPSPEQTPSATPVPTPAVEEPTSNNIVINHDYVAPQNNKVKVRFSILPEGSGSLTIKEVKLSAGQIAQTGALSDTAYDITSSMSDGTFQYDLTLPLPPSAQGQEVDVKSAENTDLSDASKVSESEEKSADTITIKGLNHFTVFVVTTPAPDTTQRLLINEIAPTAGTEWVELFNNGTVSVNLANGTGWVIRNSAGNSQSLSALGTIAAAGRVVFNPPAAWLSDVAPETVTILNELGATIDTVTISLTAPGIAVDHYPLASESVGRRTDGVAEWKIFAAPTQGTANTTPVPATGLAEVGAVSTTTTFPTWYRDTNGLTLDLMEAADVNGISAPVDAANPFSQQIGFGEEGFWWSADASIPTAAGDALLVQAVEAAFAPATTPTDGLQSSFARIRIRVDVTDAGTYTVTYPYGQKTYVVADPLAGINDTIDIGCFSKAECNAQADPFSGALAGDVGPFLTWDTFNENAALSDPALSIGGRRYVGIIAQDHAIKGSPTGNNFFRVEGPNIGGVGVNSIETTLFSVTGRLADATAPVITLYGANPVNANQNAAYIDAGATALDDQGGNLTGSIQISGLPVDTSTLGAKTVTYTVTDGIGRTTTAIRTVNVVEAPAIDAVAPVITMLGTSPVSVVAGTPYIDAGATALDNVDGDISANIVTVSDVNTAVIGAYTVTYNVSDAALNPAIEVVRTVNVVADTVAPVITVTGSNPAFILTGATYTDEGATATDNVNGNLTASIVTVNPVNTSVVGSYTVTYNVSDAAGNAAIQATRTVNVVNTLPSGLAAVGPVNPVTGFPLWYKDGVGMPLQLCLGLNLDGTGAADPKCILPGFATIPDITANAAGFPDESFYSFAHTDLTINGNVGRFRLLTEAAFAGGVPVSGDQIVFNRASLFTSQAGAFPANSTFHVVYPFGSFDFSTDAIGDFVANAGSGAFAANTKEMRAEDGPGAALDFVTALSGTNTGINAFLRSTTLNIPGYLGDGATATPVTGGTNGNVVTITQTSGVGPFVVTGGTDWIVAGKKADITGPVITLNGANPDSVAQNAVYADPGVLSAVDDFDGTVQVTTTGMPVDTTTLTPKTVTYTATDRSGNTTTVERIVNIVAGVDVTVPVISLVGANSIDVVEGTAFVEPGYSASDNIDGVITPLVVVVSTVPAGPLTLGTGPFTVTYNVSDAAGNVAVEVIRTVNVVAAPVVDITAPVVTLNGAASITMAVGGTYAEQGAVALDAVSGSLPVTTTGTVNNAVAGINTITYTATDAAGNVGTASRTVEVIEVTPATVVVTINPAAPVITNTAPVIITAPVVDTVGNPVVGATPVLANSNPAVAAINAATGELTPVGAGTTTITATVGTVTATTIVTVEATPTTVTLSPATPTVGVGGNIQFSGSVADQFGGALTNPVTFSATGGTIDSATGVFTPPATPGTVTITATSGAMTATTDVTVSATPVTAILRNVNVTAPTSTTQVSGAGIQLAAAPVDDAGATVAGITTTYESKNPAVATVTAAGLVNPVSAGKATIRITSTDGTTTVKKDFNVTVELPVESTNLASLITNNVFQPAAGGTLGSTTAVTVASPVSINVAGNSGKNHKVRIPAGTQITRVDGAAINATALSAVEAGLGDIGGIVTGTTLGVLRWGLDGIALNFNQPLTISVNVGTAFAGQTLNVMRSTNGNTAWTTTGIANPSCVVATNGDCAFDVTMASFFAAIQPATTTGTTTTSSSSTSNSSGDGGSTSAPVCSDAKPGSAPVLSVSSTGDNEVTLTWTKASDPVTSYVVTYGLSSGNMQFGNPNVGGKDTTSFTVKGLSGGQTYFFKVRAGNNCMPGDFSNEVSATPGGGVIEGAAEGFEEGVLGEQAEAIEEESTPEVQESNIGGIPEALGTSKAGEAGSIMNNTVKVGIGAILLIALVLGFSIYRKRQMGV